jgi:ribonuclease E
MLINAVHVEQKRMAIVDAGKLLEFYIQMSVREPITGNVYKGTVLKVERGLQAAFVNYGGRRDGFLPLRDVSSDYFHPRRRGTSVLKTGQKSALPGSPRDDERKGRSSRRTFPSRPLTSCSCPQGRSGVSRKIETRDRRP